jgi:thiol-disulfide isomerase/thioredoxin
MKFKLLLIVSIIFFTNLNKINSQDEDLEMTDGDKSSGRNNEVIEAVDANFYDTIQGAPFKFLVVFYLQTCPHCKNVLTAFEEIKNDFDSSELGLVTINCDNNHMSCMGFEIKHVPHMVKVFDNKYTVFNTYPSKENILKFINTDQEESEYKDLPEKLGYFSMVISVFKEFSSIISEYMRNFLESRGIEFDWNDTHSYYLIIALISLLIFIEFLVIWCLCNPSKQMKQCKKVDDKKVEDKKEEKLVPESDLSESSKDKRSSSKSSKKKKMD